MNPIKLAKVTIWYFYDFAMRLIKIGACVIIDEPNTWKTKMRINTNAKLLIQLKAPVRILTMEKSARHSIEESYSIYSQNESVKGRGVFQMEASDYRAKFDDGSPKHKQWENIQNVIYRNFKQNAHIITETET